MTEPIEDPETMLDPSFQWHDINGVLRFEKDATDRVFREYDAEGNLTSERGFTPEEAADVDALAAYAERMASAEELRAGLSDVITRALERQAQVQAVIDTPNSEVNNKPAPYIMTLARASKRQERAIIRLARLAGNILDSTDTGSD